MFSFKLLPKNKPQNIYKNLVLNFYSMENTVTNYSYNHLIISSLNTFNQSNEKNKYKLNFSLDLEKLTKDPNKKNQLKEKFDHSFKSNYKNLRTINHPRNINNSFHNTLFTLMKKNLSVKFDLNSLYYLEALPNTNKELEIYLNRNTMNINYIMNNLSYLISSGDKFNFEVFSVALFLNKFSEYSDKKKKAINNDLLEMLRQQNYSVLNAKGFDNEKFLKLTGNLHMAKLSEIDKETIQNKFFELKEANKISLENNKKMFNLLYFYDISGNKLQKIKKNLFNDLRKNYENLSIDDLYFYNSCLVFHNTKDISSFYEPLYKKLDFILDRENKNKYYPLEQKLFNYLPIPKLISETKKLKSKKNNSQIEQASKEKEPVVEENALTVLNSSNSEEIYEKSLAKFESFLRHLAQREDINAEFLIPILSNTYNYMELKSEIFELFVDKLYNNLAALSNDNYVEMLFLILQVSKDDAVISPKKRRLTVQLFNSLLALKTEPRIFLDVDKFYIYLNIARNNLNAAYEKFLTNKRNTEAGLKNFDQFKKLIKISIDLFPFSVREKEYTPSLLEDCLLSLNKILNSK